MLFLNQSNQITYQNLHQEKEEEQNLSLAKQENQITSLNLMNYFLPPESPQELEFDFEIPDSDSGEKRLEGEEEIVLDPTFNFKDSTEVLTDSTKGINRFTSCKRGYSKN